MAYIDGFVAAVPRANRDDYIKMARQMGPVFKSCGATRVVDAWASDVPDGEVTSFPMAVKKAADEDVVFGYVEWPSKDARDAGWDKAMADPLMAQGDMMKLFDGKRMIFGGFDMVAEA